MCFQSHTPQRRSAHLIFLAQRSDIVEELIKCQKAHPIAIN
jgi:hypothetical protein